MTPIFEDLIEFANNGKVATSLRETEGRLGRVRLRMAIIELLGWLKTQAHRRSRPSWHRFLRPLRLKPEYPWCADLRDLIMTVTDLNELFEITPSGIDFHPQISSEERQRAETFVDNAYRPRLMTTMSSECGCAAQ